MLYYKVADINFSIDYKSYDNISLKEFHEEYYDNIFNNFLCELNPENVQYKINYIRDKVKNIDFKKNIFSTLFYKYSKYDNLEYLSFVQDNPMKLSIKYCTCLLEFDNDLSYLNIYDYIPRYIRINTLKYVPPKLILRYYIEGVLLLNNSFLMHGVSLSHNNKGLIFTASSGVGKTTHTAFWEKKFNAKILNGDIPIVKYIDNKYMIYGSPWCGTSDINLNENIQLDAIIVIKQGLKNKIRKLSKNEGLGYILGQIRRPPWEKKYTELCLQHCEKLINMISIYELECLPNEESAEVALAGIEELHG